MEIRARRALGVTVTAGALVAAHAGGAAFFAGHDPYRETIFPPCIWLLFTGWQCPACGGTRAAYSLFHGDVVQSWQLNPLVIVLYAVLALVAVAVLAIWARRDGLAKVATWAVPILVGATLLYTGVIRNLLGL